VVSPVGMTTYWCNFIQTTIYGIAANFGINLILPFSVPKKEKLSQFLKVHISAWHNLVDIWNLK